MRFGSLLTDMGTHGFAISPEKVEISVVSPCYNEEAVIHEFVKRMKNACRMLDGRSFEIILVNDGSRDRTWSLIEKLSSEHSEVVGLNLARNYGHQLALSAGLQFSRGEMILAIDADLQDPPELLPEMLELMERGYDVVYGRRKSRAGESWFKLFTASLFYRVMNRLSDIDIPQDVGDFRLMRRHILDRLNAMPEQFRYIRGMVAWLGFRQIAFDYDRDKRFAGETKYPLKKMVMFALDAITSFSIRPLRLIMALGLTLAVAAILLMLYYLYAYLYGSTVPGWASLVTIVLGLGGFQLLAIGIIGEYVGRTYLEAKRRPLYHVQEIRKASVR